MAYALVTSTVSQTDSNGTTSSGIDTTGATLLVVVVISYASEPEPAVSDSKGNTWTGLTAYVDAVTTRTRIYYCAGGTVGAAHTFTASGTSSFASLAASAWSGAHAAPFDQQNGAAGSSGNATQTTGSVTPSEANELVVTGLGCGTVGEPASPTVSGYTVMGSAGNVSGTSFGIGHAYQIQTVATATNPAWSWSGTATTNAAAVATFKVAVAAAVRVLRGPAHRPEHQALVAM